MEEPRETARPDPRPDCAYCGLPTRDLCLACGLPFGGDHGTAACPRCAHRASGRARTIASVLPSGRALMLALLILIGSALVIGAAQVCLAA